MSYQIGAHIYSLDDIEHGILRANRKHPAFFIRNSQFGKDDPRGKYSVTKLDPRIHFALVCGAQSCPAVRLYSASNFDRGLELAASVFCNDDTNFKLDVAKKEISLSQIFQWYLGDFAHTTEELLHWILNFLDDAKKELLNTLLKTEYKIIYLKYNWSVNTREQLPSHLNKKTSQNTT